MNLDYLAIGKRVKKFRVNAELTQEKLAERLGCSTVYISQIEHGKNSLNLELLSKLSNVFECDIALLVTGVNTGSPLYLQTEMADLMAAASPAGRRLILRLAASVLAAEQESGATEA